jgi:ATP-dependent DNA helicase RecQ
MIPESPEVLDVVRRYWGFDSLKPLQAEAIRAGLAGRDSLVVLPTGGGKSLCYQVPPAVASGLDLVVSPLISLMKDQVDGLVANGYPAAALHSNLSPEARTEVCRGAAAGEYRLLFVSPERLSNADFQSFLGELPVRAFAIDEAHCISHWGHDFRPDYRQIAVLRERFPEASFHAFTATATERVREDIASQLSLRDPEVLVGRFDRPNLVYRVKPKVDVTAQVMEVLDGLRGGAAIVYCLSRKDTERLATALAKRGIKAAAYHAGMTEPKRTKTQDDFAAERLDVVVATVAFGMGIDRSDVRAVIHASLPQSVEHYQQETGRAGRDGLPAECVLLYSYSDVIRWETLLERGGAETGVPEDRLAAQRTLLEEMQNYCGALRCRHLALSRYFGQETSGDCGACDVCLDEVQAMPDSTTVAQKVLSAVARTGQRFGIGYIVEVLRGADTERIRSRGHDGLPTFGVLADLSARALTNLVYQLVNQGLVERTAGEMPVLRLNRDSVAVLKGEMEVKLTEPSVGKRLRKTKAQEVSWEGVDEGLYEHLRDLRRELAAERAVPAYVIFGDRTLRELAAVRPTGLRRLADIHGVGEKKLADPGPRFLEAIEVYCEENGIATNVPA